MIGTYILEKRIMEAINIWSGSAYSIGAVLTNPTELAYRKGNLKNHYPVKFKDIIYPDAEAAYQANKVNEISQDMPIMTSIIVAKLRQYPRITESISQAGGAEWLKSCSYHVTGESWWEGCGENSKFICCLVRAYEIIQLILDYEKLETTF